MKVWRDLEIGEKIDVGDRCCGKDLKWFTIDEKHLYMHMQMEGRLVTDAAYPMQREVNELKQIEGK